jgi:hypothetical protein
MSDSPDPITAELIVTFPDEATLAREALDAAHVAEGADLLRSTRPPWQLKARRGRLGVDAWRDTLVALVEALLPVEGPTNG